MQPSQNCSPTRPRGRLDEDLTFQRSPGVTLGVELELQLLDPVSRELAPGALRVLDACQEEKLTNVSGEFLLSMIEVRTDICQNVQQVQETLVPLLMRVQNIAHSLGYDIASGGTHPCGRPMMNSIFPDPRYQRISSKQGWMAYQEAVFGLHVHVGVPNAEAAIGVSNLLVQYLPHLLALSSNSPLWEGMDTGYASARARMFRPAAHCGIPPAFHDWQQFVRFVEMMHRAGAIESTKDLYWDIRPRPGFGTVEFRIFDAPATVECLLALVALTRCLVVAALRKLENNPQQQRARKGRTTLANESRWSATRYGLEAPSMRRGKFAGRSLREDTIKLVNKLLPLALDIREAAYLEPFLSLDTYQTGADRQRQAFRELGNWRGVVDTMRDRWAASLSAAAARCSVPALNRLLTPASIPLSSVPEPFTANGQSAARRMARLR